MRHSLATAACAAFLALSAPAFAEDAKPAGAATETMKADHMKGDHMKSGHTDSMKSDGGAMMKKDSGAMMKKDAMDKKGSMSAH